MHDLQFTFSAPLWLSSGKGAWHFVTLPQDAADAIRFFNGSARGFMPIAVRVQIGGSTWKTSVFPDKKSGSFLLAVKAGIRKSEGLTAGDVITVQLWTGTG
jgi:Domain of unknown function (DUF1905)